MLNNENIFNLRKYGLAVLFYTSLLAALSLTSFYNYLLFHTVAELSGIVVACCIFVIAWNSRRVTKNTYLLFLGIAYLLVAALDLLHMLAYEGMGVFLGYGSNLATQLWISARYVESISLVLAPLLIGRKLKGKYLLIGYSIFFALLLTSIFKWNIFPTCFIDQSGLTPFKIISEYVIILLLAVSIVILLKRRQRFEKSLLKFLIASIVVTIASEFAFTLYIDVTGFYNFIGHYLKITSFYLIYRAVVETGLAKPLTLLLKDLKSSEEKITRLARFPSENPNPVLRISKDGIILYANNASNMVLETWHCQAGQQLPQPCLQRAREVFASGKVFRFEFICDNGTILLV
ncbi:MAG: MASE3 domain-containing protein, partial [Planctomycetota bacterium]